MTASKIYQLLELYSKNSYLDPAILDLIDQDKNSPKNEIHIKGLNTSLLAVNIVSLLQKHNEKSNTHVIITEDEEKALYLYTDITSIIDGLSKGEANPSISPEITINVFPHDDHVKEFSQNELIRSEIVNNIYNQEISQTPKIIITYPKAIIELVEDPKNTAKQTLKIQKNDTYKLSDLNEMLIDLKFQKVDTVRQPGEFSVRGGIVDIYSILKQEPYRLEFFGDTIEDIRTFNPETQISINDVKKALIANKIDNPLHKVSFFEIIPHNSILWIKDIESLKEEFKLEKERSESSFLKEYEEWVNAINKFKKIHLKIPQSQVIEKKTIKHINYPAEGQISYNNKIKLLVKDLKEYEHKQYKLLISSQHFKTGEKILKMIKENNPYLQIETLKLGLSEGYIDHEVKLGIFTDHQILGRYYQHKSLKKFSSKDSLSLKYIYDLKIGKYIVHTDHGIGKFGGIQKIDKNGLKQEVIKLIFKDNDLVYLNVNNLYKIAKYSSSGEIEPTLNKLGSASWAKKKKNIKNKVKDIAKDLIHLYSERKKSKGFACKEDDTHQIGFETSFIYEDTPDQTLATKKIKEDMERAYPMDRLICGDVGFGKTEIAMRAAFKAVNNGKQVAMLVPTTVLAMQHFKSFKERFKDFPITIDYINRFKSIKHKNETIANLKKGSVDILIGTHGIVSSKVQFKDLGLLIIDEEQKFGVSIKEKIKQHRVHIDVLTLTATPIPRTLHFSLMGARDLSIISTPPKNRRPIETHITIFDPKNISKIIKQELERNGQVFFVYNRVKKLHGIYKTLKKHLPLANIGLAHGQMDGKSLEQEMVKFINGEYDVLISTNIIESGLDIPNANTIFINDAHTFGLSDLHQMRGRVGRSNTQAYCYLIAPPKSLLTSDAKKRLGALEEFSDIGDGFKIAMKDLDIRGAGNLLGSEQSGFIGDIGFEMYHRILDEAVEELKSNEFKGLFDENISLRKKDCLIETDLEIFIPETYIPNQSERINFYMQIDKIKNEDEDEIKLIKENLIDRFGKIPDSVAKLIEIVRLRWIAQKLGITKLKLKNETLITNFNISDSVKEGILFDNILNILKEDSSKYHIEQTDHNLILKIRGVHSLDCAKTELLKFS